MKILISCILLTFLLPRYQSPTSNLIDWRANRKLAWADFQAAPVKGTPNAALTSTAITVEAGYTGDEFSYHIHCQFDKSKSWVIVKNDYILSHEQGHFDIAEIYARRFNKELKTQTIRSSKLKKDFDKLYNGIMHQMRARQLDYDAQTNYSINKIKQGEWLKKIEEELKELEPYAVYL